MSSVAPDTLPRWDLTPVFPGPDSAEFAAARAELVSAVGRVKSTFDRLGIRGGPSEGSRTAPSEPAAFDEATGALDDLHERWRVLSTYLTLLVSVDSADDAAQARLSELQTEGVRLDTLRTRWTAWLGTLDVDALAERSPLARQFGSALRRQALRARHQLAPGEETLASELSVSGGIAWGKLHGNLSSQIRVEVDARGARRALPMSSVRNLADDADRTVRRSAYEAELAAWRANAVPLAAALNGVKGEVGLLAARRGWTDPLEPTLLENAIDRPTLEAMHEAVRASFPDFRRYMRAKARALGLPALAWYDLFAPIGEAAARRWSWADGCGFVERQFATFSDRMAGLARRAFADGWVDAEPRFGKRDGAFCSALAGDESRVMMNWSPTFDGISTLAHELGHAYHNLNQGARPALQRQNPMTLAETASTFCEVLIEHAHLAELAGAERLALLEQRLRGLNQIVVDIHSRFLFETRLFEARRRRELSVDELCDLMLGAQTDTYGDGLDGASLHPFMWAVKPHYYSTRRSFYNYPYTFGALFANGLFARYRRDPDGFKREYDAMLNATAVEDAATLAARFGVDIRTTAFWTESLDDIRAQIDEFDRLTAAGEG